MVTFDFQKVSMNFSVTISSGRPRSNKVFTKFRERPRVSMASSWQQVQQVGCVGSLRLQRSVTDSSTGSWTWKSLAKLLQYKLIKLQSRTCQNIIKTSLKHHYLITQHDMKFAPKKIGHSYGHQLGLRTLQEGCWSPTCHREASNMPMELPGHGGNVGIAMS